jgi:uncharacterized membrane protein YdbT with pleckstrin-like domain
MDLVKRLSASELFGQLSADELALVAGLARAHTIPAGTTLSRQADIGTTFFVIDSGEAIIQRVDDRGFARPVATLREGDTFGTTSLMLSEPRDATVVSSTEMNLWTIERRAFQDLLASRPSVARALSVPDEIAARLHMPDFAWLGPSERVVRYCHRHWMPLLLRVSAATLVLAAVLGVVLLYLQKSGQEWDPTLGLLVPVAIYIAFVTWHWFDWVNDQVVVTTQRISYREQVALFYETRNDVPIDRVQNINVISTLAGRAFGYGTMIIETASATGTLKLEQIPSPERVRDAIWNQTERAQATQRAAERRLMTDALASQLGIDTREALPDDSVASEGDAPNAVGQSETAEVWGRLVGWLRSAYVYTRPTPDQVVWRKHPIFLVRAMILPLTVTIFAVTLAVLSWFGVPVAVSARFAIYPLVTLALSLASAFWLAWVIIDWANDQYIITGDRIIDVEQRPFSLRSERREASLSMIQNARFIIPHFWAALWGYGNVIVQTAGHGDFTFDRVSRPSEVQAEIFRRIEAYRERGRQQEATRRRQEMAEWFSVYRELGEIGQAGRITGDLPRDVGADRDGSLS